MNSERKALQEFLEYSRNALKIHMQKAIQEGKLPERDAEKSLANFDDRSDLILQAFDKQVKQSGGALSVPAMKGAIPSIDLGKAPSPEEIQKEINDLLNFDPAEHIAPAIKPVLDNTLWVFIPSVRDTVKRIVGTVLLLGSLEDLPIFGPLIGSSMDIAAQFMPALGTTFQNILPNIIGLAPIPYAAFIGEAAGYVFSSVMMFMTLMTQASRGEFIEALEAGAGMIPVIGTTLSLYVSKGKKIYDKAVEMKQKIITSLSKIQGLIFYMIPLVSKKVAKILEKILPIFTVIIKKGAVYVIRPATFVLDNMKPLLETAKARLASLEEVKKGGRRYTKHTRRARRKNHRARQTRANRY
jgi:hypothetical protein